MSLSPVDSEFSMFMQYELGVSHSSYLMDVGEQCPRLATVIGGDILNDRDDVNKHASTLLKQAVAINAFSSDKKRRLIPGFDAVRVILTSIFRKDIKVVSLFSVGRIDQENPFLSVKEQGEISPFKVAVQTIPTSLLSSNIYRSPEPEDLILQAEKGCIQRYGIYQLVPPRAFFKGKIEEASSYQNPHNALLGFYGSICRYQNEMGSDGMVYLSDCLGNVSTTDYLRKYASRQATSLIESSESLRLDYPLTAKLKQLGAPHEESENERVYRTMTIRDAKCYC